MWSSAQTGVGLPAAALGGTFLSMSGPLCRCPSACARLQAKALAFKVGSSTILPTLRRPDVFQH